MRAHGYQELGVSERLAVLIEGESLLNDGTSIVVFSVFFNAASGQGSASLATVATQAVRLGLGGPIVGFVVGSIGCVFLFFVFSKTVGFVRRLPVKFLSSFCSLCSLSAAFLPFFHPFPVFVGFSFFLFCYSFLLFVFFSPHSLPFSLIFPVFLCSFFHLFVFCLFLPTALFPLFSRFENLLDKSCGTKNRRWKRFGNSAIRHASKCRHSKFSPKSTNESIPISNVSERGFSAQSRRSLGELRRPYVVP